MKNQSPTPNTKDADKPELPADGCSAKLWAMYIGGMDEYEPMESYEKAVRETNALRVVASATGETDYNVNLIKVVEWPFGAKSHAQGLKNKERS